MQLTVRGDKRNRNITDKAEEGLVTVPSIQLCIYGQFKQSLFKKTTATGTMTSHLRVKL